LSGLSFSGALRQHAVKVEIERDTHDGAVIVPDFYGKMPGLSGVEQPIPGKFNQRLGRHRPQPFGRDILTSIVAV